MDSMGKIVKPRAICVTWPMQGHINPMMNLAKLLHYKGFHITFVSTEVNRNRLPRFRGIDSLDGLPFFQFMSIPDPLPDADSTLKNEGLYDFVNTKCLASFRDFVLKIKNDATNPPITCIVSDALLGYAFDAARELGIPNILLWTASVCSFMTYSHFSQLLQQGLIPLKDMDCVTNGYLDTIVEGIPGMEGIRLKDISSFTRVTHHEDVSNINVCIKHIERARRGSAIIFNTFDELEDKESMLALSTVLPPIYAIGPIHELADKVCENSSSPPQPNLWKEDPKWLDWLDSKDPNSVIYVSFGSVLVLTTQQQVEFAWGLANSNKNFLWIIKPDTVTGEDAVFSPEFMTETKERGLIASWCSQRRILSHPSIAGFITHCGWNSTLESISSGVPMICCPVVADQQTNCWYCCNKWGIGMEMDPDVSRDVIEKLVLELMDTTKGKEMKMKAMEMKRLAEEAVCTNGSSQINLDKLIKEMLRCY